METNRKDAVAHPKTRNNGLFVPSLDGLDLPISLKPPGTVQVLRIGFFHTVPQQKYTWSITGNTLICSKNIRIAD